MITLAHVDGQVTFKVRVNQEISDKIANDPALLNEFMVDAGFEGIKDAISVDVDIWEVE